MQISLISIFPQIFESFLKTSLIYKAQEKWILKFNLINLRDYAIDEHQTVDDQIYGWGSGMLLMAEPIITAVEEMIQKNKLQNSDFSILFPAPSQDVFNQKNAHGLSKKEHLIFICGRYEGIDYRVEEYFSQKYPASFQKLSLGNFVTLWGEVPSMVMIEAITRLIPGVIKESESWIEESYALKNNMQTLEAPNYTRPQEVRGLSVPEILLTGNEQEIKKWRTEQEKKL